MKTFAIILFIGVLYLFIFGYILNYEEIKYTNGTSDYLFKLLDFKKHTIIKNSNIGEAKENFIIATLAILSITNLIRIITLIFDRNEKYAFMISTSIMILLELIYITVLHNIIYNELSLMIGMIISTLVFGISLFHQISLYPDRSGIFNIYDNMIININNETYYNKKKKNLINLQKQYIL